MFFVRTATEQDLPRVNQILNDTWHATYDHIYGVEKVAEISAEWHSLSALKQMRQVQNSEFLVSDNGDVLAGMAYATQNDKTIKLHHLYVHPDFQGEKAGFHMMIEIENSFMDADKIQLEVEPANENAIRFYKKYGFQVVGETQDCGREGSEIRALIMEKLIIYADD